MKKILFVLAASTLLFACDKDKDKTRAGDFKSSELKVYEGKAWSTVKLNKDGAPERLSLVLNDAALNSVPAGVPGQTGHDHTNDFIIPLHQKGKDATPFNFIMLNWNPNGHEPDGVYTIKHFDIHYYMTTPEEVMNYMDDAKLNSEAPAQYIPANHISGPGVPMMGKHYIDANSPELTGQASFTQTFIFGSYDKKVVFYEPMITHDFLKTQSNFERSLPVPAKFQKSGYYPTKMTVKKQNGLTEVSLESFVYRTAS